VLFIYLFISIFYSLYISAFIYLFIRFSFISVLNSRLEQPGGLFGTGIGLGTVATALAGTGMLT
jgi:hypothetical protein